MDYQFLLYVDSNYPKAKSKPKKKIIWKPNPQGSLKLIWLNQHNRSISNLFSMVLKGSFLFLGKIFFRRWNIGRKIGRFQNQSDELASSFFGKPNKEINLGAK